MGETTISVIIPVYNAVQHIRQCVESVLNQTIADFELLLVDDGSYDDSGAILDGYAEQDARVKVIHQLNGGVSAARAAGVRQAKGEWVCFVDADDSILPDALESMLAEVTNDVDIVVFEHDKEETITALSYGCLLLRFRQLAVWGKLYRRVLLNEYAISVPRKFKVGEDFLFQLRLLANVEGMVKLCTQHKYVYTSESSTSVQRCYKSSYEYERDMIEEAEQAMHHIEASRGRELCRAFLAWRLVYLGGMMGLRYRINLNDAWIIRLRQDACKWSLTPMETIAIYALSYRILRFLFVAEKCLRRWGRKIIRKK